MRLLPLNDPAKMDALLANSDPYALLDDLPIDEGLGAVRLAHIALVTGNVALMENALAMLDDSHPAPARGVRMMLAAQIGDHVGVMQQDSSPQGGSPLELEDAAHASAAKAVVTAQMGAYDQSICHISVAIALSKAAGLHNRVGMLEIERERVLSLRGSPRPEELQRLLLAPMSKRRKCWGRRTWAEALMGLGDYHHALRVLGHASIDSPADRALRGFLHALLQLPEPETSKDEGQEYHTLAQALRHPEKANWRLSRQIQGQPQKSYALLIEALVLSRIPATVEQAARLLGSRRPQRGDQGVLHDLLWLNAMAHGIPHPCPTEIMDGLQRAADVLRITAPTLEVVRRFLPGLFVLLGLTDQFAALGVRGLDIPLLAGSSVLHQGEAHRLPGRIGRLLVLEGAGIECDIPAREEKRRYATRIAELGVSEPINLGRTIQQAGQLESRFRFMGEARLASVWAAAKRRAINMVGKDLAHVLQMHL